jgi:hypothetical protein
MDRQNVTVSGLWRLVPEAFVRDAAGSRSVGRRDRLVDDGAINCGYLASILRLTRWLGLVRLPARAGLEGPAPLTPSYLLVLLPLAGCCGLLPLAVVGCCCDTCRE